MCSILNELKEDLNPLFANPLALDELTDDEIMHMFYDELNNF